MWRPTQLNIRAIEFSRNLDRQFTGEKNDKIFLCFASSVRDFWYGLIFSNVGLRSIHGS